MYSSKRAPGLLLIKTIIDICGRHPNDSFVHRPRFRLFPHIVVNLGQVEIVDYAVGIVGDRCFHVAYRFFPACRAEGFSAKNVFRNHSRDAVQPHHFRVPHSHHVEATTVFRIDSQTFECL